MKGETVTRVARTAGVLYLAIFVVFPLSSLLGRERLVIPGDAATTAANIVASETVFRAGMVGEAAVFLIEIVLASFLYVLLRPVSRRLSLAAAFGRVAEAIVQAVNVILAMGALLLVSGSGYAGTGSAGLAALFLDASGYGVLVWGFFFGLHLALLGYLVLRSSFWPKVLGILLMVAGAGYLAESALLTLFPQLDSVLSVVVLIAAIPGELAFTVWLLWKGVDASRWEERAQAAQAL